MDYVVGSVAALITGNVTPSRPKLLKRALTPTKHQPSPNVTPKSEFVDDRSIFLSPTMQKKKAIVKKSPKRIFQNPDLETTDSNEGNLSLTSPKADKVKKHLKDELEGDGIANKSVKNPKPSLNKGNNKRESTALEECNKSVSEQVPNESTPKKKKKKRNSEADGEVNVHNQSAGVSTDTAVPADKSPKKMKQRRMSVVDPDSNKENDSSEIIDTPKSPGTNDKSPKKQVNNEKSEKENTVTESNNTQKKKKRNRKKKPKTQAATVENSELSKESEEITNTENQASKKKNKKRKKSKGPQNKPAVTETEKEIGVDPQPETELETSQSNDSVNPNAVTDKESDSEHESDDEIESENEEINKKVFEAEKPEESSDEEDKEDEEPPKVEKKKVESNEESGIEKSTEEEIQRTLFVGNVLFTAKCKKEIKKIFGKHGQIETIRIRTVPIKDGRYTPKLALIKNELHPERTTVNVYIKYSHADSIEKALVENNTVLNEHHLRVSRSSSTGAEHDPRCSVFIGNLPFAMEDEALRNKFEKCGNIQSVRIIRDKKTNAGKGFGYVNFESKDGVELALALTEEDLTVKNRILRVKRCTQLTNKKKPVKTGNNQNNQQRGGFRRDNKEGNQQRGGFRRDNSQGFQQRGGFRNDGNRGNQQRGGFRGDNEQGNQQRGAFRGGNNQVNQQKSGFTSRTNQGMRQRNAFGAGNNQNQRGGFNNQRNQSQRDEEGREGAHRRVMNKRKNQDGAGGDGPPNKIMKDDQPNKEKKSRKEFVGMTAEKKKKRKFDKGQKKKKALSEILTK